MRLILCPLLTLSALCAQTLPDADTLLKHGQETVQRFHSLQYKEDTAIDTDFGDQHMKIHSETTRAVLNPGKMRLESKAQGLTMIVVSDGESTWMYNSMSNEYTHKSAALGPQGMLEAMGMSQMMPNLSDVHLTQKTTGEETLTIDGQKHDCWVVHTDIGSMELPAAARGAKLSDAVMTTWIDRKFGLDLQSETSMKVTMPGGTTLTSHIRNVKKDLQLDGAIADAVFTFTPPEGAGEVEKMSFFAALGPQPEMLGKTAPDFTLRTPDGKPYPLAGLKGKPVLLDFWATWCGPCRKAIPSLAKIYAAYQDQGLVVLGVDAGEDLDTVQDFLKKTPPAYPAVLSGESTILKDYHVTAYPTFVLIGPDGKIVAYEQGFGGDQSLRSILEKAGLSGK